MQEIVERVAEGKKKKRVGFQRGGGFKEGERERKTGVLREHSMLKMKQKAALFAGRSIKTLV